MPVYRYVFQHQVKAGGAFSSTHQVGECIEVAFNFYAESLEVLKKWLEERENPALSIEEVKPESAV